MRGRVFGSGNVWPAPLGPRTGLFWLLGWGERWQETGGQRVGLGGCAFAVCAVSVQSTEPHLDFSLGYPPCREPPAPHTPFPQL